MHDFIANKIFIAMQHLGERYVAVLQFDDASFAKQLYPILLKHIGNSIRELGELDLSHTI